MSTSRPLVVTGQQIGAGWTPALSVVKALAAKAEADRLGGEAVFWMADEDHDALEVAATVGFGAGGRLRPHRFRFAAPLGTATGWLAWTANHQAEAEALWGEVPGAPEPTLRGHFLACGAPLWRRGVRAFSPTEPGARAAIQDDLRRWRALGLERDLVAQAERLESARLALPLDPRTQGAWFSLDPSTGARARLDPGEPCPPGHWLSPGAALRPLMQQRLLPGTAAVVLGPAERAYWRLAEPLWERVGLEAPRIVARPSAALVPRGAHLDAADLDPLRTGDWAAFARADHLPSSALSLDPAGAAAWGPTLLKRVEDELQRTRARLARLDRRHRRDLAAARFGTDPEKLRQALFPLGRPQERVLPGLSWLRDGALLDRLEAALAARLATHPEGGGTLLVEAP
ncbi:MAG: bacillithiol biosynthesis BshC [Holophagaceae bacterium]